MNLKASTAVALIGLAASACSSSSKPQDGTVSFTSCAEAKAAGYQNMKKGEPGYSAKLDADGDGVACVS